MVEVFVQFRLVAELVLELVEGFLFGYFSYFGDLGPSLHLLREGVQLRARVVRHERFYADVLAHRPYYSLDVGADEETEAEDQDADERGRDGGDGHEQVEADVLKRLGEEEAQANPHRRTPPSPCRGRCGPLRGRPPVCA